MYNVMEDTAVDGDTVWIQQQEGFSFLDFLITVLLKSFVHHCMVDLAISLKPTWEAYLTVGGFIKSISEIPQAEILAPLCSLALVCLFIILLSSTSLPPVSPSLGRLLSVSEKMNPSSL